MTTATTITLDAVLEAAERQWRAWRLAHPVQAMEGFPDHADASELDYGEMERIQHDCVPQPSDPAFRSLVFDDRVWTHSTPSDWNTAAELVQEAVEDLLAFMFDRIDAELVAAT